MAPSQSHSRPSAASKRRNRAVTLGAHHIRLIIASIAAVLVYYGLPGQWGVIVRLLTSWNVGALLFLVLAGRMMLSLSAVQIHKRFEDEDEAAPIILLVSVIGSVLVMAGIVVLMSSLDDAPPATRTLHIALAVLTVVQTWLLIPTLFTLRYAGLYYSADTAHRPLRFPDDHEPVFWDFAYFSFTISAACQTADVSTVQGAVRRLVLFQTVLSFFFNVAVVGLAINVTAGLIGK